MPDEHLASQPRIKNKEINNLHDLTRYVQSKAEISEDNDIASFPIIQKACSLLLSNIITATENPNSVPKDAFINFLDVLSHAESFRLKINETIDTAIAWHIYFEKRDSEQALCPEEAEKLEVVLKSKDEWRTVYMQILRKVIVLDLYYTFISKPWFVSDLMLRVLEYNPHMFKPIEGHKPCSRTFILLLSEDETQKIKDATKKGLQLVKGSHEWLEKEFGPDGIIEGLYSQEFQKEHPPPTDLQRLQDLLHYYLKHITSIYSTLITIFPPKSTKRSVS